MSADYARRAHARRRICARATRHACHCHLYARCLLLQRANAAAAPMPRAAGAMLIRDPRHAFDCLRAAPAAAPRRALPARRYAAAGLFSRDAMITFIFRLPPHAMPRHFRRVAARFIAAATRAIRCRAIMLPPIAPPMFGAATADVFSFCCFSPFFAMIAAVAAMLPPMITRHAALIPLPRLFRSPSAAFSNA